MEMGIIWLEMSIIWLGLGIIWLGLDIIWQESDIPKQLFTRACLKIHSRRLHAPLRGIFGPDSVSVARYASIIGTKSPTKWDAQPTESNFQTRSRIRSIELKPGRGEIMRKAIGSAGLAAVISMGLLAAFPVMAWAAPVLPEGISAGSQSLAGMTAD